MNKLSALVPLKSKITIYVPTMVSVDQEVDNVAYVERVACTLSACFGDTTASPVRGYRVSDSGELIKEAATMVFTYCSTADAEKYIDNVVSLCYKLEREMGQEAVALGYNSEMYFIWLSKTTTTESFPSRR